MSYRKNEDGSVTVSKLIKFDNTLLEVTASSLETAQHLFKQELTAYRTYANIKTNKKFNSPSKEGEVDYIIARDSLAEIINKEYEQTTKA